MTDTSASTGPERTLVRRAEDRTLGGVAGGLADCLGMDVGLVRIGFVVAAFFTGGAVIPAYLAAWVILPERGEAPGTGVRTRIAALPTPLKIAAAIMVVSVVGNIADGEPGFWLGTLLVVVGILLLREDAEPAAVSASAGRADTAADFAVAPAASPRAGAGAAPAAPADAGEQAAPPLAAGSAAELVEPPLPWEGYPWSLPPELEDAPETPAVPTAPRQLLGRITVGLMLVALAFVWVLDGVGVVDASLQGVLALAITGCGLGLLVGARWGRAYGLIVAGIVLSVALMAANTVRVPLQGGIGERVAEPAALSEVADSYELAVGSSTIDLSNVDFTGERRRIAARVVMGELVVVVGPDVTVTGTAVAEGGGDLKILGEQEQGSDVAIEIDDAGTEGGGVVELDLGVTFGQITVEREER